MSGPLCHEKGSPLKALRPIFALAALALAFPAQAQTVTVSTPTPVNSSGQPTTVGKTFIINPDGTVGAGAYVVIQPKGIAVPADRGLSVATAGTAQQLMAANTSRRGYSIQNQSSGSIYINETGTATADFHSLMIPAGGFYETPLSYVGTGAVSIISSVSAAPVYAREW